MSIIVNTQSKIWYYIKKQRYLQKIEYIKKVISQIAEHLSNIESYQTLGKEGIMDSLAESLFIFMLIKVNVTEEQYHLYTKTLMFQISYELGKYISKIPISYPTIMKRV